MARIRTIKPEFFSHFDLYELEVESGLPVRVAFAGLWTQADREGRFKWKPPELKIGCLPYDDVDFSRVLDALASRGFVVKYEVRGKEYGVIPTFGEHQVINNREKKSVIPSPNEINELTREPRDSDAKATPLENAQGEGKGKEGKGRDDEDDVAGGNSRHGSGNVGHPNLREIFQVGMADDWEPSGKTFPAICLRAGVKPDYTPGQLGEFKNFYLDPAKNKPRTQHDWERLFSGWLKGDNGRGKATSTGSGSDQPGNDRDDVRRSLSDADNLSWAADLIEPAGGCGG